MAMSAGTVLLAVVTRLELSGGIFVKFLVHYNNKPIVAFQAINYIVILHGAKNSMGGWWLVECCEWRDKKLKNEIDLRVEKIYIICFEFSVESP